MITKKAMSIRFSETDVRSTGRDSMGVIGIKLREGDEVVGMQLESQGEALLIVSENGMGKRTMLSEFTLQKRAGMGLKCYNITEKTGDVVGVKAVNDDHEVMLITTEGIIIQTAVNEISILKRITSGVKIMDLDEGVKIARMAKVREKISDVEGSDDVEEENKASNDSDEEEEE